MQVSETFLHDFKGVSKSIGTNQNMNPVTLKQNKQWNFDIEVHDKYLSIVDSTSILLVTVYARQSTLDSENFSCGILVKQDSQSKTLSRYNGSSHVNAVAHYECHIHHATTESINRGDRKPEHSDTQVTTRYTNLNGAFSCLCDDYNIDTSQSGLFGVLLL